MATAKKTAVKKGKTTGVNSGAVEATIRVIGAKWTVLIIRELMQGTRRFGQIEKALD